MAKYAKSKKPLVLGLRLSRLSVKKNIFLCFHWTSQTRSRGQDDGSIGYRSTGTSSISAWLSLISRIMEDLFMPFSMIFAEDWPVPAALAGGSNVTFLTGEP